MTWKSVLAALRSSEFWALVGQAYIAGAALPVPEEFKALGWAYIGLRVLSKVVKYVFPNPDSPTGAWFKNDIPALLLLAGLAIAVPARAQLAVPVTDVSQRAHVTVNGGAMVLTKGADWSGASLGGALLYNLHPKFSVFGGYDHGFPINSVDEKNLNVVRAVGSVRIHPNAFAGFGYAWFDKGTKGGLAQLIVTKQVLPRVGIAGLYAHIFSTGTAEDFEYFRVYLNYHLLGKE